MYKLTLAFFIIAMMAAILGFTTDIDPKAISIARKVFFGSLGLTFLFMLIGVAIKRSEES